MHFSPSHNALTPSVLYSFVFFYFSFHNAPTSPISHATQAHDPYSYKLEQLTSNNSTELDFKICQATVHISIPRHIVTNVKHLSWSVE